MARSIRDPIPDLESHPKTILEACKNGQLTELQNLFQASDVQGGDSMIYPGQAAAHEPPDTISMFVAAITNDHLAIIKYLLSTYQMTNLVYPDVIRAMIKSKNMDVFRLVVQHNPHICLFEFHYISSFLTELCREGPCASQLVGYLLDHDADPNAGGHVQFSPLGIGLRPGLSTEILRKMIVRGAVLSYYMIAHAINLERIDALRLFFGLWRRRLDTDQGKRLHESLESCPNKQIIRLTQTFIARNRIGLWTRMQWTLICLCRRSDKITTSSFFSSREVKEKKVSLEESPAEIDLKEQLV